MFQNQQLTVNKKIHLPIHMGEQLQPL